MACNAQTINVLNSLVLTEGETTILTPNYDVFMMYQPHRDAIALDVPRSDPDDESVYVFASKTADGKSLLVNLTNAHMNDAAEVMLAVPAGARVEAMRELASADPHDCNTTEEADLVRARSVDVADRVAVHAGAGATGEITVRLAPTSVNTLRIAL